MVTLTSGHFFMKLSQTILLVLVLNQLLIGSETLHQLSEGLASFNILLEESNDLVSWSNRIWNLLSGAID